MRRTERVYLSGRISGLPRETYLARFAHAEEILRREGYAVLNPCRLAPCRWPWLYRVLGYELTLLYDLWHLWHRCDRIFFIGQDVELEQLAQNHVIIDRLNQLMQADDYEDIITELKKDGTVSTHINPLISIRDRAQKQFLSDWKQLRLEALQRIALQRQNRKK